MLITRKTISYHPKIDLLHEALRERMQISKMAELLL